MSVHIMSTWYDHAFKAFMQNIQCVINCLAKRTVLLKPYAGDVQIIQSKSKEIDNHRTTVLGQHRSQKKKNMER